MHQRAAGMNAGEVILAKRLMTMAVLNVMNGGEEEATFVALMAWCCLTRERQRPDDLRSKFVPTSEDLLKSFALAPIFLAYTAFFAIFELSKIRRLFRQRPLFGQLR